MKLSLQRLALLVTLLAAWSGGSAHAQQKIATVKMRDLFENYVKARENDATFKKKMAGVAGEAKAKREAFLKGKEELSKFAGNVNDPAAQAKLKELKEMEQSILQFENKARADADEESRRLRGELLVDMRKVIDAKAKAAGYALVINVTAENTAGLPDVPYSSGENDITKDVITELNAGMILKDIDLGPTGNAPKAEAKPETKPAEKKPEKKK
ncbi:MAG: OmpH family outer membrane protein [Chthoniobacteraceae bacterium]